jgi:hypothetical protein
MAKNEAKSEDPPKTKLLHDVQDPFNCKHPFDCVAMCGKNEIEIN